MLKRHFCVATGSIRSLFLPQVSNIFFEAAELSRYPLLPPRRFARKLGANSFELTFLNVSRRFQVPFDWHPQELAIGTRLWKLNLHYMEFLESLDDADFELIVEDWIQANSPYMKGYWLDSWNSYALSIRVVVWMQQLAVRASQLRPEVVQHISDSLFRQVAFLHRNLETDIRGNHLIKNIKALLWASVSFDGGFAGKCRHVGLNLLNRELDEQILEDGFHYERSPSYHCQVFTDLLECWLILEDGNLRQRLERDLHKMAQVIADTAHADGCPSLFNDGGLHYAYSPAACLAHYRRLLGGQVVPRNLFAYPSAGYYGCRLGLMLAIVDYGSLSPDYLVAHGHGDVFSFELSYDGQRIVVDAGVFEYSAGEMRAYSRSTSSHNTVDLDGFDQAEFFGAFRVGRRPQIRDVHFEAAEGGFSIIGTHDGYAWMKGKPMHQREVIVQQDGISVKDHVFGGSGQMARAYMLFHPDCDVLMENRALTIRAPNGLWRIVGSAAVSLVDAWYCPDLGVKQETVKAVFALGRAPVHHEISIQRVKA